MVTGDLLHDDSLVLRVIALLVADVGIRALPGQNGQGSFCHATPAAWYSEPAISTVWRLPSEYRDVPSGYF